MIARLQMLQIGQVVRNEGPESHFSKRGTPTMGGVMILFAITLTVLLWSDLSNPYIWAVLVVLLGYGAVGFVDDYRKVVRKNTDGLIARWKYFLAVSYCSVRGFRFICSWTRYSCNSIGCAVLQRRDAADGTVLYRLHLFCYCRHK